jgi:hypothetical protein
LKNIKSGRLFVKKNINHEISRIISLFLTFLFIIENDFILYNEQIDLGSLATDQLTLKITFQYKPVTLNIHGYWSICYKIDFLRALLLVGR